MANTTLFTENTLGFSLNKVSDWLGGYYQWLNEYTRDQLPCMINSNDLAANSFQDVEGRNDYFPAESGTSESQFMTIRACAMAYLATGNYYWLDKAIKITAESLDVLFRGKSIPDSFDTNNIWLPHWLFNVKGDFTAEQYYLDYQIHFENGTATFESEFEARKIFSVRALDATLEWQNPFADIIGISYEVSSYTAEGTTFTVNLNTPYTGDALVVYSDLGGPTICKGEVYEAWPIWRKLDPTEIDCAVDSMWWAYDSFKLLSEITGDSYMEAALNSLKETIPYVVDVSNLQDYLTTTNASTDPLSTPGSYIYQDRDNPADITRDETTGMIELDIPEGTGSVQIGRGGLSDTWSSDDMSIEIQLSSNLANKIQCDVDPQVGYVEDTRWSAILDVQGTGNSETFTLKREDFVKLDSLLWSMYYLPNSSENVYNGPHGSVIVTDCQDENGRTASQIEFYRGIETGTYTYTTTDDNGNPETMEGTYTYDGWAQCDIIWDKNSTTLNSLPNFHYNSSGQVNIRIQDANGWLWESALPESPSFTDYTPDLSGFVLNAYQQNSGTPPSSPTLPIDGILFDAIDMNCSVELCWLGDLECMPLNENICTVLLSVASPESQNLSLAHIRPLNMIVSQLNYVPYVGPFTVNLLNGNVVDWRGMPYAGYQAPYVWQDLGDDQGVTTVLNFMKASQDAYEAQIGLRGPFAPVYLWDRWDSKDYGEANTWTWNGPDPNTLWGGYQYRGAETVARTWYNDSQNNLAEQITMDFLNCINNNWNSYDMPILTDFPQTNPPTSSGDEPHMAALLLRTALYAYLAGGDETVTLGLIQRCLMYLDRLYIPTNTSDGDNCLVAGTWSPDPSNNTWYGFWGAEIVYALSLLLQNSDLGTDTPIITIPISPQLNTPIAVIATCTGADTMSMVVTGPDGSIVYQDSEQESYIGSVFTPTATGIYSITVTPNSEDSNKAIQTFTVNQTNGIHAGDESSQNYAISVAYGGAIGAGIGISGSYGVAMDGNGDVATLASVGGGGTTPTVGIAWQIQITNAESIDSLAGWGVSAGASVTALGFGCGIDCVGGNNSDGTSWGGVVISVSDTGDIVHFDAEAHAYASYTWESANLTDEQISDIKNEVSSKIDWLNNNLSSEIKDAINTSVGVNILTDS